VGREEVLCCDQKARPQERGRGGHQASGALASTKKASRTHSGDHNRRPYHGDPECFWGVLDNPRWVITEEPRRVKGYRIIVTALQREQVWRGEGVADPSRNKIHSAVWRRNYSRVTGRINYSKKTQEHTPHRSEFCGVFPAPHEYSRTEHCLGQTTHYEKRATDRKGAALAKGKGTRSICRAGAP